MRLWPQSIVCLLTLPWLANASISHHPASFPLSFEKTGSEFSAASAGRTVKLDRSGASFSSETSSFRIEWKNKNLQTKLVGEASAGFANRFIGNDPRNWRSEIPLFQKVRVRNLYPGVDLLYYGHDGNLEYDLTVAPGTNPDQVRFSIDGAQSVRLDAEGNLRIDCGGEQMIQHRPAAFQIVGGVRHPISSRFAVGRDNHVRFSIGAYDRSLPLTIDPIVSYSTYLGGTGLDEGRALTEDSAGNVYLVGRTFSTIHKNSNVLLLKITPSGSLTQSIFGGTLGNDSGNAVAVDSSGNVFIAGSTSSQDFPISATAGTVLQTVLAGSMNAFLLALPTSNTSLLFSTFFGGSYSDEALAISVGPNNYLYIVGDTTSPDMPIVTSGAFQVTNHGSYDGFLVCFTSTGGLVFGTYLGGTGDDHALAITVDSNAQAYVVGSTSSTDFPSNGGTYPNSFQNLNHGNTDGFALKFFAGGQLAYWGTYLGGASTDVANGVALDSSGNVYIAGTTASDDFPTLSGAYQASYQGATSDGFVLVLQNNGQGLWGTFFGSAGDDAINAVVLDASANVILTGTTDSSVFPTTPDAVQTTIAGGQDTFVARLNSAGTTLLYSTYFGGSGTDIGLALLTDTSGRIYLTGSTGSSNNDFPVTAGARQTTYGGGTTDAFFSVFGCATTLPVVTAAGVVNAGSYLADGLSPGAAISIFGSGLGCTPAGAASLPLPTALSGISVQVNGTAIPLYFVSETQINAQLPYETASGSASLTVTGPGGTSAAITIPVVSVAPGIFNSAGAAAVLNQDGSVNSSSNPAKSGSVVTVFFTGPGPLTQSVTSGAAIPLPPPYIEVSLPNSATVGGVNAPVYFMGMSPGFAGLAQANLTVPSLAAGVYPVVLTIGGTPSPSATIAVTD